MKLKKYLKLCGALMLVVSFAAVGAQAQQGARNGRDAATVVDVALEQQSLHDLQVARHYYKQRKAYRASLDRTEEIIVGNPNFGKLDEALYIAGMSSLRLSESRGKQASNAPAAKLREEAEKYLTRLVTEFPESPFRHDAEQELNKMKNGR